MWQNYVTLHYMDWCGGYIFSVFVSCCSLFSSLPPFSFLVFAPSSGLAFFFLRMASALICGLSLEKGGVIKFRYGRCTFLISFLLLLLLCLVAAYLLYVNYKTPRKTPGNYLISFCPFLIFFSHIFCKRAMGAECGKLTYLYTTH